MTVTCCNCAKEMKGVAGFDTGSNGFEWRGRDAHGVAINVYFCDDCMIVARTNVWEWPGTVFVLPDNTTVLLK